MPRPSTARAAWPCEALVRPYGVAVRLRSTHPDGLQRLIARLPIGWQAGATGSAAPAIAARLYSLRWAAPGEAATGESEAGAYLLQRGRKLLARTPHLDAMLEAFADDVQLYVAEWAPQRVFVHAGVVAWKGRAVVIPGRSFSGKTTLVAALVRAGATYYSDEYAVLDARGRVHPFARPLAIRAGGQWRGTPHAVETLGGRAGKRPLPVALIVASRYRAGARWQPHHVSAGQGALELLANTVSARRDPRSALTTLHQAVKTATVLHGVRGEAEEAAADIRRRMLSAAP